MPRSAPDPIARADLLLVDASNLLHALRRSATPPPAAALIGRLRAVIPPATDIVLVFDGSPEPGMRRQRIAAGLTVEYAAPRSADAALLARTERLDPAEAERVLAVSDDRELRAALELRGVPTARASWLIARLTRATLSAPAAGNPRPPAGHGVGTRASRQSGYGPDETAGADRPGWTPGRGATVKRGNARRRPRHRA